MKGAYLTISAQRASTELELGLVTKRTVCGGDSHFSKIWKPSICWDTKMQQQLDYLN